MYRNMNQNMQVPQNMNQNVPMEEDMNQNIGGYGNMNSYSNMNIPQDMNMPQDIVPAPNMNINMNMGNSYFPACSDLPERLIKAMTGEQDARLYYQKLMTMAPTTDEKNVINKIYEDEKKHYNNFSRLYTELTGRQPSLPSPQSPNIPSYVEGLKKAIFDETDAYEFYRDTFMCTTNPTAKEIFFEALTDENEHAMRLNYLYSTNIAGNKMMMNRSCQY